MHPIRVPRANGHRYRVARKKRLAADDGDICWWCGHPGATQIDHLEPRSVNPWRDVADITNMAPIHGGRHGGCRYCPSVRGQLRRCNQERGNGSVRVGPTHRPEW